MPASAYASVPEVINMPEYGWIMPYGRVLNMPDQPLTEVDQAYSWICLNNVSVCICLNNAEYDWICGHIPEKT